MRIMGKKICRGFNFRVFAAVLLILSFQPIAAAQETVTAIRGVVRSQTGMPVSGASITASNPTSGLHLSSQSDEKGDFEIAGLAPGLYDVEVSRPGFVTQKKLGVKVSGSQPLALEFVLERGPGATGGTQAAHISEMQLVGLPLNGRSYSQLATLQAGVADTSAQDSSRGVGGGSLTVAGGRPTSNNFLLDGTNIMDTSNQVPRSAGGVQLGSEAVHQVQVFSASSGAEYGRGSGGTLNSITRSGTNELHGTFFEYFRNSKLDARNFFDPGADPPPFKRNQFGFILTGPIRKEKTFFMGTFEAMRDRLTITETTFLPDEKIRNGILTDSAGNVVRTIPVSPAVRPYLALYPVPNQGSIGSGVGLHTASVFLPTDENYFSVRVDHKLSDYDSFFARYTFDDATGTRPQELYLFRTSTKSRQQYLTLVETHIFSLHTLNSFRFGYTRPVEYIDSISSVEIPRSLHFVPGAPHFGQIVIPGIATFGPTYTMPEGNKMISFQFANDVVAQRGAHALKFGVEIHRYRWDVFNSNSMGAVWSFNSLESFLQAGPEGTELTVALPGSNNKKAFRQTLAGFYIQDGYRASSRLHIELGLRYEPYSIIKEKDGRTSFLPDFVRGTALQSGPILGKNPSLLNLSPRLGFSWSPGIFDNLVVSGGVGIYYDPLLEHVIVPQKNSAPFYRRVFLPNFDSSRIFPDAVTAAGLVSSATPFGIAILNYPHTKTPMVLRYNLNLQQSLPGGLSLRASYVGARGNHLFRGYEANLFPASVQKPDGSLFLPPNAGPINPAFNAIGLTATDAQSFYNALQISASLSPRAGISAQANYTFSKSVDDASVGNSGSNVNHTRQYPLMRTSDRGLSEFDIRHRLSVNYFYAIPVGRERRWWRSGTLAHLFGGWRLGGVFSFRTGTPFHPIVNIRTPGYLFAANRPNLRPGASNNPTEGITAGCSGAEPGQKLGGPDRYFDPCSFSAPPPGTLGTVGRNTIPGPSVLNMDLSLQKDVIFANEKRDQFRAEFFNVPNHPNFAPPPRGSTIVFSGASGRPNPTAGRLLRTITTSRQIQFGLRFSF